MSETTISPPGTVNRRQVARSTTIVMLLFIASRVLGLFREAVIGQRFGDLPEYAAYLAAFRLPDLLFNLVAGGALASAFIPTLTQYLTRNDEAGSWRLTSAVANWLLLVLSAIAILAGIAAPLLVVTVIAPGFADTPAQVDLTVNLLRLLLVSTVTFSISGLVMGVLNAHDHFLFPAVAPVLYNLGILGGALFLAPTMGVYGLAIGVIVGAAAHLLIQIPTLYGLGFRYWASLGRQDPPIFAGVRQMVRLMGPRVIGAGAVQLMFVANTILASYYASSVLPALNYAWIIMLLPHGIFASSIATAIFPTFSRMAATRDQDGMRRALSQILRVLLFVVIPCAVGLFVLRVPIIELLFQRGQFTATTTQAVAWALGFYAFGLIAHACIEIVNRAYYALQDTRTPVTIAVGAMLLNILLSVLLIPVVGDPTSVVRGPQGALALANTLASTLEMVLFLWFLRPKMGGIDGTRLLASTLRMGIAAALMGLTLWGLLQSPLAALSIWLFVPAAIGIGVVVYVVVAWLLRVEEMQTLTRLLLRRNE